MRFSVTGTTELSGNAQERIIYEALYAIAGDVDKFYTGGADGVDSYCAQVGFEHCINEVWSENTELWGVVPAGLYWNRKTLEYFDLVEYINGDYMDRNDVLVARAEVLLAFPKTRFEERRSGTWATIRRARKAKVPVWAYPLDGSAPWVEDYAD